MKLSEIDPETAKRIGIAFLSMYWGTPANVSVAREGHVYFVQQVPTAEQEKDSGWIIEPVCVALSASDGRLVGGSFYGASAAKERLSHEVFSARTANGLDVTSILKTAWPRIVQRAKTNWPDQSPTMVTVDEILGSQWKIGISGVASRRGQSVRLRTQDLEFLRRLSSIPSPNWSKTPSTGAKP